jgi:large subunit ribosomal protein L18
MRKKVRNSADRRWRRRRLRVRKGLANTDRTVLTVYRSARHIYAQLVDPTSGQTLGSASSRAKGVLGDVAQSGNQAAAGKVGAAIARIARDKNIENVVFNRNGFLYHGRVKALADAARKEGLKF